MAATRIAPLAARQFDLVVYGATGFTGRLVAEYLAKNYSPQQVRWAIAGRSEKSLKKVQASLASITNRDVDMILANSSDPTSLEAMVKQTRVVVTTVGPFAKYGSALVAACAASGTGYVDSTGESPWVRDMIDQHDATAKSTGALMVPMCGFDSIPSDVGTMHLVNFVRREMNAGTKLITSAFKVKGGASGGTIHSAIGIMEDPVAKRQIANPHLLCAPETAGLDPATVSARTRPSVGLSWNNDLKSYTGPFVMSSVNEQVVRRSAYIAAQRGQRYTSGVFQYREHTGTNLLGGIILTFGTVVTFLALTLRVVRWAVKKMMPRGTGPSLKARESGFMRCKMVAVTDEPVPRKALLRITGSGDPGYKLTSQMVAEAGLSIALSKDTLPGKSGGIFTPSTGLGATLVERLNKSGIVFTPSTL